MAGVPSIQPSTTKNKQNEPGVGYWRYLKLRWHSYFITVSENTVEPVMLI